MGPPHGDAINDARRAAARVCALRFVFAGQALWRRFEPHVSRGDARMHGELTPLVERHGDACNDTRRAATRVCALPFA